LAELDEWAPVGPCLEYAERMRAAGNANIRIAIYPGVHHGYESIGGFYELKPQLSQCNFFVDSERRLTDRKTRRKIAAAQARDYVFKTCMANKTVHNGGDQRVKAQAVADMLQFLRDVGVIEDAEARAVVPDCTTIPEGIYRLNCIRARAGWTGDLVALGIAFRYAPNLKKDDALAARLFRLAADRGQPQAQTHLAEMYWRAAGVPRDLAAAHSFAHSSAMAGEPRGMNLLGAMARDGVGQKRDDNEAMKWFRQAAELRDSFALAHLGRMYWDGRGVPADRAEAVRLWRKSVYYENPWGRLYLAEALEKGEGVARDVKQAAELYSLVADQNADADAKRRAGGALTRMNATPAR
jgi:hypothetical protein